MKVCSVMALALALVSALLQSELTLADPGFLANGGGIGEARLLEEASKAADAEKPKEEKKKLTPAEAKVVQMIWYMLNVGKQAKTDDPPAPGLILIKTEKDGAYKLYAQANAEGISGLPEDKRTTEGLKASIKLGLETTAKAHYGYADDKVAVQTTNSDIAETAEYKKYVDDGTFGSALTAMTTTISGVLSLVPKFLVLMGITVAGTFGFLL